MAGEDGSNVDAILHGQHDDVVNWEINQGQVIDINTQSEIDEAKKAAQRIYADAGHTMDEGDWRQLEGRIRNGQSLSEIVANTFDEAKRRFQMEDTPQSRAEEAAGLRPTYDSQSPVGSPDRPVFFDPPDVMMEQLVTPAREQADLMDAWPATSAQGSPSGPRTNIGPAHGAYGTGTSVVASSTGSDFPWGLVLIGAAVLVGGYLLLRKKGK